MTELARAATVDRWIPRRDPGRATRLLGIVNLTPDSFFDGGAHEEPSAALRHARLLLDAGADALDLGAESSRPGAAPVPVDVELARLLPVLEPLAEAGVPLSVDTTKAEVARRALAVGATIVNDISALERDPEMAEVCAEARCAIVLMHMRGTPETMRSLASYDDVVDDVAASLERSLRRAVHAGVLEETVFLDPGIGFAKTTAQSLELLRRLPELASLGRPIRRGASRKSFLDRFGGSSPADRLAGTLAVGALAALAGVEVLRVHDVAEHVQAVRVAEALRGRSVPSAVTPC